MEENRENDDSPWSKIRCWDDCLVYQCPDSQCNRTFKDLDCFKDHSVKCHSDCSDVIDDILDTSDLDQKDGENLDRKRGAQFDVVSSPPLHKRLKGNRDSVQDKWMNRIEKGWRDFTHYTGEKSVYEEQDFVNYFEMLVEEKSYKKNTLHSVASRLNRKLVEITGKRLGDVCPGALQYIKDFDEDIVHNRVLRDDEVKAFLAVPLEAFDPDPENLWIVRKTAVALSYVGGLRFMELRHIKLEDIEESDDHFWIPGPRGKLVYLGLSTFTKKIPLSSPLFKKNIYFNFQAKITETQRNACTAISKDTWMY